MTSDPVARLNTALEGRDVPNGPHRQGLQR